MSSFNFSIPLVNFQMSIETMQHTLQQIGINLEDPNFNETPRRFVKYLAEFLQPYNPEEILKSFPIEQGYHSLVVQSSIPFRAVCAHHLVPFFGRASLGYVPDRKVVGLSKLARLVEAVSHSTPSLQEVICDTIVDDLERVLKPQAVMCVIHAEHMCMACRGIAEVDVVTSTASIRGRFQENAALRQEFYELCKGANDYKK
jgi:GTP cyclohydrolase I